MAKRTRDRTLAIFPGIPAASGVVHARLSTGWTIDDGAGCFSLPAIAGGGVLFRLTPDDE